MRIAITGASGALGKQLLRRLTQDGADRIVASSRDEQKQAALQAEFAWHPGCRVYAADIRDAARLPDLFAGCECVVHGAARKVVTANPDEAGEMVATNVQGTLNVIEAARQAGVRKVLFISSDKAVHPESQTYGLSKALAERCVVAANARTFAGGLRLSVLRYGNVLASTGSVVLRWRAALAESRAIDVSDPQMTRFWLTLDQAVDYVLGALGQMRGGETFVPHVPAADLLTLAAALTPDGRVPPYVVTGIRPGGEKLHEQLLTAGEARRALRRGLFYVVPPDVAPDLRWDAAPWLGEPVASDLLYRSDVWPERLDVVGMRRLLGEPLRVGSQYVPSRIEGTVMPYA